MLFRSIVEIRQFKNITLLEIKSENGFDVGNLAIKRTIP